MKRSPMPKRRKRDACPVPGPRSDTRAVRERETLPPAACAAGLEAAAR